MLLRRQRHLRQRTLRSYRMHFGSFRPVAVEWERGQTTAVYASAG